LIHDLYADVTGAADNGGDVIQHPVHPMHLQNEHKLNHHLHDTEKGKEKEIEEESEIVERERSVKISEPSARGDGGEGEEGRERSSTLERQREVAEMRQRIEHAMMELHKSKSMLHFNEFIDVASFHYFSFFNDCFYYYYYCCYCYYDTTTTYGRTHLHFKSGESFRP
tara:strand:+ start:330 stop:833 length:504 start_codon:yes stop_codon:yes gene_type:complete